jgi:hypothetical protein
LRRSRKKRSAPTTFGARTPIARQRDASSLRNQRIGPHRSRLTRVNASYNELKALLKSAAVAAAEQAEVRDDARHIRAAMNRRLTPPAPAGDAVRARAMARRMPPGPRAAWMAHPPRIAGGALRPKRALSQAPLHPRPASPR